MSILEELKAGICTGSAEETEALGARLAQALPDDVALALSGDLGSGKTTLVRGIAHGLGIRKSVTSPTYNIYTIYQGRRQLVHMDAYRLSDAHELDTLSIAEFLASPFLIAVEWPEHIPGFFEDYPCYSIELKLLEDHRHHLKLVQD
ncbi:tRNA (adenosine(37)-N6)-threonylcarbamoyltransferase complex ATPase subunit type 1 TsaE [Puniceicoccales bacterium CK1056]|uniref:tRNA threonylcarbamoyladenosine biosynthesis protein TsaE n=1 Tax=Oceanipulchritudo coccoides TaxID=2706888 RepID=A0A6B2M5G1_9BACT|nr:tRNA (adenosine(37)-N6)-threonylcarbamoyltransferase complex ATPase subunit type 1 TsaE [Oceanipulchritudo coccoides]NDV63462.1 tRNA (adenosine(37)-N6)-threonylcarbamoyltransferase complex ATPase subunit type 1 TsaE [Oceanipulchritudo coccoides]